MRILIDIGHPAHVHLLKNLYSILKANEHQIFLTVKSNLDSAKSLLAEYKIPFIPLGNKSDGLISKAFKQIIYDLKIRSLVKEHKIEIGIGTSINLAHASKISKMKSIVLDDDDDEVQPLFVKFAHPFCNALLSPESLKGKRKKKDTIYYAGFHELAYLHPNRFTPDPSVLNEAGLSPDEKYFVLRFNSFKAHHDVGVQGILIENKRRLIETLLKHGKVFITTEREIDPEFEQYKIKIPPHKIHSFIYYATMLIGDSQTMTSEAAVLGTPSIRSNSLVGKIAYLEEEEHKYGLTFGFKPNEAEKMFDKIDELLKTQNLKEKWQRRRQKLLTDKIDVTDFLVWFVENYPDSYSLTSNETNYQNIFKEKSWTLHSTAIKHSYNR